MKRAAVSLPVAVPVAVWWAVGDLSEKGADARDRMFRPFELPAAGEHLAGAAALVAVVTATVVLTMAWYRDQLPPAWVARIVPLCLAGAILGGGWRVLTAASVGANIGGGLVLVIGLPLAALLVIAAAMSGSE